MAKSLQSEFVTFYKEKLELFGFRKVKGRQPYFVRVVNDEILHIITFMGTKFTQQGYKVFATHYHELAELGAKSAKQGYKAFYLMCGVATVYRKEINFSVPPRNNSDWLVDLGTIDEKKETEFPTVSIPRNLMIYYYNDENINAVINETYEGAKIIISELDKVSDMDEALKYFLKYDAKNVVFSRVLDDSFFDEEGLFYARKEFDYTKIEKVFEDKLLQLKNSNWSERKKKESQTEILEWEDELKQDREEFINNDEAYEQGMKLLEEHYNTNIDKLAGYGLDIQRKN